MNKLEQNITLAEISRVALLLAIALFFLFAFSSSTEKSASAAESDNLRGYAWSSTTGWISMNCVNTDSCGTSDYGVKSNPDSGNLSGFAWSPNIGWISFNAGDVAGCPEAPCEPNIDKVTGKATGWFKALSGGSPDAGGWSGFARLSGSWTNSVTADVNTLSGYAWGNDVLGWIDFSGVTSSTRLLCEANYGKICSTGYNTCGLRNFGTFLCDGTCSSQSIPPETSCADLNNNTSGISITAKPKLIPSGGKTTLTWTGAGDCLVYNPAGVAIATSTSGTLEVTGITKTTRYVLMCTDALGKISNASVSVSPGVRFEEI